MQQLQRFGRQVRVASLGSSGGPTFVNRPHIGAGDGGSGDTLAAWTHCEG